MLMYVFVMLAIFAITIVGSTVAEMFRDEPV